MTSLTPTPTTRTRRVQGILAVGAGALLLVGGSSFALWTVQSNVAGGTITAGNLDVVVADGTWQDASSEHAAPVDIADLADFRIVPGDVLEGTFPVDVAALGDNLVGDLTVAFASPSGALLSDIEGVTLDYTLIDGAGNPVGLGDTVTIVSADSTAAVTGAVRVDNVADGTAPELRAVVTATFDVATPDQVRAATEALLGDLTASVTQKRP
jgi:alternate signal-mediated exported protein